jgi:hypothetical protein
LFSAFFRSLLEMILRGINTAGEFHYIHHDPGGHPYGDRNLLAGQVLRAAEDAGCESRCCGPLTCARWNKPPDPRASAVLDAACGGFRRRYGSPAIRDPSNVAARPRLRRHCAAFAPCHWTT